jgi:hypothetical protein
MTDEPKAMPHGIAIEVGDITTLDPDRTKRTVRCAILVQFASVEDFQRAIERRRMTFGLFEDERPEGGESQ